MRKLFEDFYLKVFLRLVQAESKGGCDRLFRRRKSSVGRLAEEAVDGVLHVLLGLEVGDVLNDAFYCQII